MGEGRRTGFGPLRDPASALFLRLLAGTLLVIGLAIPAMGQDTDSDSRRPPIVEEARRVFETKCAECHGPAAKKPKGGFGYVTDLEELASDPALVVPGHSGQSELYLRLVSDDPEEKMPPEKAKGGPVTAAEVEIVRKWIEMGAPTSPLAAQATAGEKSGSLTAVHRHGDAPAGIGRLLRWLGRFHPVVVHFPIALLLAAVLAEILMLALRREALGPIVTYCLVLGAAGALVASALGWLAAEAEPTSGGTLDLHRWLGIAAAGLAALAAAWRIRSLRGPGTSGPWFRLLLVSAGLVAAVAGHYGAMLVHGNDHFNW